MKVQPLEDKLRRRSHQGRRLQRAQRADRLFQPRDLFDPFQIVLRGHGIRDLHPPTGVKIVHHLLQRINTEILVEDLDNGTVEKFFHQLIFLFLFADIFHLYLPARRSQNRVEIADPRNHLSLPKTQRPFLRIADDTLVVIDGHPNTNARGLIDLVRLSGFKGHIPKDLLHELRHLNRLAALARRGSLLFHNQKLILDGARVVRPDLDVKTILQRSDNPPPTGIILGIGARYDDDIQRETDLIPFDLDVLLFHQIKKSHLHLLREIGKLVDGEDPAIGPGYQAIMNGLLVCQVSPLGHLDRVDLSDNVRD